MMPGRRRVKRFARPPAGAGALHDIGSVRKLADPIGSRGLCEQSPERGSGGIAADRPKIVDCRQLDVRTALLSSDLGRCRAFMKILVVEDEPLIRLGLASVIEEAGYEVVEAANADDAITAARGRSVGSGWC